MNNFKQTHKIVFTKTNGKKETWEVMLCENESGSGPAFTKAEWELGLNPDWELTDSRWLFLGYATPGCVNGTVTIERIEG